MKSRFACFIDAGYVRAALKVVDDESKQSLGPKEVCAWLEQLARGTCPGSELLRHYWCDAAFDGKPSPQHTTIAALPNVKLRLGRMSSEGKQKGVDARINSDMRELAELRSVDDIILFTGDEDMVLGVSQAQAHGARVHLVLLDCSGFFNSTALMHEADTVTTWRHPDKLLDDITAPACPAPHTAPTTKAFVAELSQPLENPMSVEPLLKLAAADCAKCLKKSTIGSAFIRREWGLVMTPYMYNAVLYAAKKRLSRDLAESEKETLIRALFELANAEPQLNLMRVGKELGGDETESTIIEVVLSFLMDAPEKFKEECIEFKWGGALVSQYAYSEVICKTRVKLGRFLSYSEKVYAIDALYHTSLRLKAQDPLNLNLAS